MYDLIQTTPFGLNHLVTSVAYLPPLVLGSLLESSVYATWTFGYCPPFIHLWTLYLIAARVSLAPECAAFSLWTPLCVVLYKSIHCSPSTLVQIFVMFITFIVLSSLSLYLCPQSHLSSQLPHPALSSSLLSRP